MGDPSWESIFDGCILPYFVTVTAYLTVTYLLTYSSKNWGTNTAQNCLEKFAECSKKQQSVLQD